MQPTAPLNFEHLGIALLLGMLVGLQRQRSDPLLAGLRTFPLITVLGTLAAGLDKAQGGYWILPVGFLGLVAVVAVSNTFRLRRDSGDLGVTTAAAIMVMYLVGAYVVLGDRVVAIAIGGGVAVLLQFKPELHGIAARLGDEDLRAIMTFVLITCIILPILPNQTYPLIPPFDVLNPFEIWLMVVLMVGISLGGYLLYKFVGQNASVLLSGILGGAISSTATTVSYARRSQSGEEGLWHAALVIGIATTVVYLRVMTEIAAVAPGHFVALGMPIGLMMLASGVAASFAWLRVQRTAETMPPQKNPTELRSALVFAGLYAAVLMGLSAAKAYFGVQGLYAVAILSGLTDMDAITLSTARLVRLGPDHGGIDATQGWRLVVAATMANLIFKWSLCFVVGHLRLGWRVGLLFSAPVLLGALLLVLWK